MFLVEKETQHQEGLPFDIVYDILLRLQVKTLTKFQCVSKSWYSLISQSSFQEDHYRLAEHNPLFLISRHEFEGDGDNPNAQSDADTDIDIDINNNTHYLTTYNKEGFPLNKFSKTELQQYPYHPIQSCRGLVCFGPMLYRYNYPILVCNPSTEEIIALPPTEGRHLCIRFGYMTSTKGFKVIRFFNRRSEMDEFSDNCCDVFILGTSEWRPAKYPPPDLQYQVNRGAPFIGGALYLLPSVDSPNLDDRIYAFDIENEEYTTIRFPEYYYSEVPVHFEELDFHCLKELEGSLYLEFHFQTSFELWRLMNCNSGDWVKEHIIFLNPLGSHVIADPLAIMGDGRLLLSVNMSDRRGDWLYTYNPQDKSFTPKMEENGSTTLFVESFFPLGSREKLN